MKQIKNCKVGNFVKYDGILCQINCFFTNPKGRCATLIETRKGSRRIFTPLATEKVECIGDVATDDSGIIWVATRRKSNPFATL